MKNESILINLSTQFDEYIDAAIIRASYIYPEIAIKKNEAGSIEVNFEECSIDKASIKKEITYLVYREKIYKETLPIRKFLYDE